MNLVSNCHNNQFYKINLDLDPKTLVVKPDLDMVKMYRHIKNEVKEFRSCSPNKQTDT